ncbi:MULTISPECIES: hypothetical protein [unclassified Salinivibrio]|uniref:hypothetical protein n=1 Tax=unclassified Salinivibrio TaxID=2636825 RepID=UPI001054E968|nr:MULTISPECIES: hypothetical protein [unclassified Salinivibrio]
MLQHSLGGSIPYQLTLTQIALLPFHLIRDKEKRALEAKKMPLCSERLDAMRPWVPYKKVIYLPAYQEVIEYEVAHVNDKSKINELKNKRFQKIIGG